MDTTDLPRLSCVHVDGEGNIEFVTADGGWGEITDFGTAVLELPLTVQIVPEAESHKITLFAERAAAHGVASYRDKTRIDNRYPFRGQGHTSKIKK